MAVLAIAGVMVDATEPTAGDQLEPERHDLEWPRGEPGAIRVTITGQDGAVADLTGCSFVLGCRRNEWDETAAFVRAGTLIDVPTALVSFAITQSDTLDLDEEGNYRYDLHVLDGGGGRWQVVPSSRFRILPIVAQPGDTPTAPSDVAASLRVSLVTSDPDPLEAGLPWLRTDLEQLCISPDGVAVWRFNHA
jgi:hypothetical protein